MFIKRVQFVAEITTRILYDTNWVVYKPEMFKAQDFIEATLTVNGSTEVRFIVTCSISHSACYFTLKMDYGQGGLLID